MTTTAPAPRRALIRGWVTAAGRAISPHYPLETFIARSPVAAYEHLAAAYNGLGRHTEAVRAAGRAVRLQPQNAPAHFHLGVAYASLGIQAAALAEHDKLKELDAPDLTPPAAT